MAASDYPQEHKLDPKWMGYFAALFVLLIALAQVETIRPVVVALTWLLAVSSLMLLLDNQHNLLQKVGL